MPEGSGFARRRGTEDSSGDTTAGRLKDWSAVGPVAGSGIFGVGSGPVVAEAGLGVTLDEAAGRNVRWFAGLRLGRRLRLTNKFRRVSGWDQEASWRLVLHDEIGGLRIGSPAHHEQACLRGTRKRRREPTAQKSCPGYRYRYRTRKAAWVVTARIVCRGFFPGENVVAHITPDGKWVIYQCRLRPDNWTLMRVPAEGGNPEPVPIGGKLKEFDEYQCPQQPGTQCVLRTVENGQFVFSELDPVRGKGRELARTESGPTVSEDWSLSPDGSEVAIPDHDPHDAKIRLVALRNREPGMAERTITLNGLRYLNGVVWAADGRGLYVSVRTSFSGLELYTDLQGHSSELLESPTPIYMVPSPDGRHVGFPGFTARSNAWLFHGL